MQENNTPEFYRNFYIELKEKRLTGILIKEKWFWEKVVDKLSEDGIPFSATGACKGIVVGQVLNYHGPMSVELIMKLREYFKSRNLIEETVDYFYCQPERIDAVRQFLKFMGMNDEADVLKEYLIKEKRSVEIDDNTPDVSFQTMMKAAVETQKLWWGSTGWAVVFAIYKKHGYDGSMYQFVDDVCDYTSEKSDLCKCTLDSVQKPMAKGRYIRDIAHWKEDGAKEREVRLGEALEKWLSEHNSVE